MTKDNINKPNNEFSGVGGRESLLLLEKTYSIPFQGKNPFQKKETFQSYVILF